MPWLISPVPLPSTQSTTGPSVERGLTYRMMERYDEALADLASAIALHPRVPGLSWNEG